MKLLLIIGGILGFGIGLLFSWAEQSSGATCIWHACLAAYLTAVLMRWWGAAWRKGLAESLRERQNAGAFNPASLLSKSNRS
jgi:hypothetical protein